MLGFEPIILEQYWLVTYVPLIRKEYFPYQ